ncbi:hypothetical protein DEU56DRAFT_696607, partial [Suillus clintonianus]|uniref:uncharacterized protein n=1 Tax=Suillus clintonianus TaxID=1904413 RepID=UPI001B872CB6
FHVAPSAWVATPITQSSAPPPKPGITSLIPSQSALTKRSGPGMDDSCVPRGNVRKVAPTPHTATNICARGVVPQITEPSVALERRRSKP